MRVLAAVLLLLAAEGGTLWYLAGDRVTRLPAEIMTLSDLQQRFEAEKRATATVQRRMGATTAPPTNSPVLYGDGTIRLPFRLSESVVEDCRRTAMFDCDLLDEFLGEMAGEWRDANWAAEMEARIERAMTRENRGKLRIRALECRNTRCAVEVASEVDYARVSLASDDVLDRALRWYGASVIAWEEDPHTGIRTIVTVATWQARSKFEDPPLAMTEHQDRE